MAAPSGKWAQVVQALSAGVFTEMQHAITCEVTIGAFMGGDVFG